MTTGFALCERGFEQVTCTEIRELIGRESVVYDGIVTFSVLYDELAVLCYRAQSVKRVGVLLSSIEFRSLDDIHIDVRDLAPWFATETRLSITCERIGEHQFTSQDAGAHVIGEVIQQSVNVADITVDYGNPTLHLFLFIVGNRYYFGIDFAGVDLSRRDYKVFAHAAALKGTVAYGILRLAGYTRGKRLLSIFDKGIVGIEAVLYASGKALNYYRKDVFAFWKLPHVIDKDPVSFFSQHDATICSEYAVRAINGDLRHVSAGQKNAKIAGIKLESARIDVEWLDVKFEEESFDIIIAQPSGHEITQMSELFRQSRRILARDGLLVIISAGKEFSAPGFHLKEQYVICRGESQLRVQMFSIEA